MLTNFTVGNAVFQVTELW